ncbi:type I restriction endonuclease subunit R [Tengunoibacter tsumagoiensis]|uniref:Type I restriction enzyme endonuclease subunit n=1 Tax=Tengunoibacter tsumagoiensis TaxID=2014871 RepID=A0A402A7X7_9CHLR|nr:HsdR family type I site-specific deoxyribonuclease [Tengunoibacter tsumagoiensis]GCE15106.1 restriction endonuclease [Tengunoibacter tsumagoiensis]
MSTVGRPERATQDHVIELFKQLGYTYLGNWINRVANSNLEEGLLRVYLRRQGYSEILINKTVVTLEKLLKDQICSLYDINKDFYGLLRYGVHEKADVSENTETVWLIDWEHPLNNDFSIAEEVTITDGNEKRPDIVLYVNGIALGVLELKKSVTFVSKGIRQNLLNQKREFIGSFFSTVQLVMAGNESQGLRYGTTGTSEKYYLTWKEASPVEDQLDRGLLQLCAKERLLEIIHDFTIFDGGIKKLCRPNQYFGVRAAQERVRKREGGIIWHTQGSGKSLTMVWLAKWLRENIHDSRILIITDREELDEQIEGVFLGVNEQIYRTTSGPDLITQLNKTTPALICSLIHKFGRKTDRQSDENDKAAVEAFIKDVTNSLPSGFKGKGNIYIFVDECHRTQSGKLHEAMKAILPGAMFIGFTGTPLLKNDKDSSIATFGTFIHTYKYDEAVRDGVVLDLRYEARDIEQSLSSPAKVDQWFEAKTRGLNDIARAYLKQRWATMQKVLSSQDRLEKIVADILLDMEEKPRLMNDHGNAILVAGSIYQACRYYEIFTSKGFKKCAIITSYKPGVKHIQDEESGEGETERLQQYDIYMKMLGGKSIEKFEDDVKEQFIKEPGQMKLLIVVDKLLTGFDAPSATYLYIDKKMQDHGLFQAICRVNRLDDEDKDYGYIIDYKDLFKSLESSVKTYTSEAFAGYEQSDVDGLLSDRITKGRERLEDAREAVKALCEPVQPPKGSAEYRRYFCARDANNELTAESEPRRLELYKLTTALVRAYANLANDLPTAGYSAQEIETLKQEVDHYEKIRQEIRLSSGDAIDLKMYEPAMRHLIDTYIRAEDSEVITTFENAGLLQLLVERGPAIVDSLPEDLKDPEAMAEAIENNTRRVTINERPLNPVYYDKMSERLDALIKLRQEEAIEYKEYILRMQALLSELGNQGSSGSYPHSINTRGKQAVYDTIQRYGTEHQEQSLDSESLTNGISEEIRVSAHHGWRGNQMKERKMFALLHKYITDEELCNQILKIMKGHAEF